MLRQDLNLYKSFKVPVGPSAILTWNYFWLSVIIITFFFMCHLLYSFWSLHSIKATAEAKQAQSQALTKEMINLRGQFPPLFFSADASTTLLKLREELNMQQRLVNSVREKTSFSTHLQNFSILIVPNVWLTDFIIDSNADTIQLSGKSLDKESLQQFINNLDKYKDYRHYNITLSSVTNEAKNPNKTDLQFDINMVLKP